MAIDPALAWMMAFQGAGGAINASQQAGQTAADRAQRERERMQNWQRGQLNDAMLREGQLRDTATTEAGRNPFRDIDAQGQSMNSLAMMRDSRFSPVSIQAPGEMQQYVPKMSGGFSYNLNPAHTKNLDTLYNAAAAGKTTPTMTNPANYGKTGAIDMGTGDYASGTPSAYDPQAFGPSYADTLSRIEREGVGSGGDEEAGKGPGAASTVLSSTLSGAIPLLLADTGGGKSTGSRLMDILRRKITPAAAGGLGPMTTTGQGTAPPPGTTSSTPGPGFDPSEIQNQNWFIDPTDGLLKVSNPDGSVTTIGPPQLYGMS